MRPLFGQFAKLGSLSGFQKQYGTRTIRTRAIEKTTYTRPTAEAATAGMLACRNPESSIVRAKEKVPTSQGLGFRVTRALHSDP